MTSAFQNAINDFLIIVIAIAVVLVLVVILGSKRSRFRRKFDEIFAQDSVGTSGHKMKFNREYYITGEKNMRLFSKGKNPLRTEMVTLVQKVDERRRTLDTSGTSKLYNEYY